MRLMFSITSCIILGQIQAADTFNYALQTAGTQLIAAKDKFNSSLIAQATLPILAGCALGLCQNTWYTIDARSHYYIVTETPYKPLNHSLWQTIRDGGYLYTFVPRYDGTYQAGNCGQMFCSLEDICQRNMFFFGIAGLIYALYKNSSIPDRLKITAGTLLTAFMCNAVLRTRSCLLLPTFSTLPTDETNQILYPEQH
jgi:hypothetical protein